VRKEYPLRDYTAVYQSFTETQFKRALRFRNLSSQIIEKRSWSQTDIVIRHLQQHHYVNYVGALAGHDCGYYEENGIPILVTSSPKLIEPVKGNWDTLSNFLTGLLWDPDEAYGDEQQIVTYGWLQTAYNAFRVRKFQPGQAFAMAGPIEAGKSLWQSLITEIIGGRSAKEALFLQGRTNFNGELFEAEHLLLEDEAASTDHRARMALGTAIKNLIANRIHSCNPKHPQIVNLRPWWRLSVSLNDREERLLVLPPLTEDIADKIILLRATVHPMPMPADTAEEKEAFWKQPCAELPAFLYYLVHEFVIPADWRNTRFGIRSWQHPSLLSALEELSQPIALLELIDRADIWSRQYWDSNGQLATFKTVPWEGTALELRTKLLANPLTKRDAERLLDWTNATGQYLNDLARIRQTRVKFHRDQSRRWYEIFPP
jgi:hypothetical protein